MSKRLATAARPMSKSGRMGTTLQRPPTGARLGTARPGTKSGVAPGTGALSSAVQVADRPMTQQVRNHLKYFPSMSQNLISSLFN